MSLVHRSFTAAAFNVAKRSTPRILSRSYSEKPYPFTKPAANAPSPTPREPVPKSQYPFTNPSQLTRVASQSRPTERPGPNPDPSPVISKEAETGVETAESTGHLPDYTVAENYTTSSFSPVPLRVMDGSEDNGSVAAAVLSGAPIDLQARTVRIYKPAKSAEQSGDWHQHHWQMDWDVMAKGHRWENPLMGWQASADAMQGTRINFKSKSDAIRFAEKQGYEYFVQEPQTRKIIPKAYATQFVHSPGKVKQVRTK